ncbi:ATP-binding protein [Gemmatimonas sp.]|uniref:sensor histidine kinase n=1 Tax=Gemmatimonas sp. TaxID=1962908 RepID=UPI0037C0E545
MIAMAWLAQATISRSAHAQILVEPDRVELHVRDMTVQQWGVDQGLPQGTVSKLVVDRNGHVWAATFGGLVRFDGLRVETYTGRRVPVMVDNTVSALLADADGSIWFGTLRGTIGRLVDGRLVDTLPTLSMGADNAVQDLFQLDNGTIVARVANRVHRFHAGRWLDDAALPVAYSPLFQRAKHAVWYATVDGVTELTTAGGRRQKHASAVGLASEFGRRMYVDRRGRFWNGGRTGLSILTNGVWRRVAGIDSLVQVIASNPNDSAEVIWVASGHTLFRVRADGDGEVTTEAVRVLSSTAAPISLAFTGDGILVVGTLGRGLFTVRSKLARVQTIPTRQSNPEASNVVSDRTGRLWVSSGCGDAHLITLRGTVEDSVVLRPGQGCLTALAFDDQRRLWIGHRGGVRRVDRNGTDVEWKFGAAGAGASVDGATMNPSEVARPLLQAGNRMLVGSSDGRIGEIGADDQWRYLPGWAAITKRPIESMTLDTDGSLWVGQSGRITRWTDGRLVVYTAKDGVPASIPRVLHPDRRGGIWIGSYGHGLIHFRPGHGSRVVPLPDETVSGFVVDSAGLVWMPGNRGLTVLPIGDLAVWVRDSSVAPDARLLTVADGVPEGNRGFPAGAVVDGRHLAFASVDGLVIVDLARLPRAARSSVVLIDRLVSALRTLELPRVVRLETNERTVDIEYTMPVYRSAANVQFRYRLEGRDDGWILLGATRQLQLAALPPGRFTLELQGREPGGTWYQAEPLRLDVVPFWHERTSVRVLSAAALCALLFGLYAQRQRTMRARNDAMELSITARRDAAELSVRHQRELAQVGRLAVAGELTAALSHELAQPLTAIVNNAEVARRMLARRDERQAVAVAGDLDGVRGGGDQAASGGDVDDAEDVDDVDEVLHDILMQGQRASQVIREVRRFLKQGRGEREPIRAPDLLESVIQLVRQEFVEAGVALEGRVDPRTPTLWAERVSLQQVLVKLLQNALEATRGQPVRRVLVRARPARDGIRISVADSGPGFAPDVRARAFEPFVTSRSAGMGMGLAIARRLIESHGGSMSVGQLSSGGAVVSCWLPVSSALGDAAESISSVTGTLPHV